MDSEQRANRPGVNLLRDDDTLRRLMKIVEELVFALIQRSNYDEGIGPRRQHLFLAQLDAFELSRTLANVVNFDLDTLPRRHFNTRGIQLAVVHFQLEGRQVGGLRRGGTGEPSSRQG